ncbi:MAG: hypothetical protein RBS55_02440 [Bacteroidales bacterium]|nr:hypothetical protein [Bacteroidales bacterium]
MKKITVFIVAFSGVVAFTAIFPDMQAFCQTIDLEKTYAISTQAAAGDLGEAIFNEETGNYELTYVFKASKQEIGFEKYIFDQEFNFLRMEPDKAPITTASEKYDWWDYQGEKYVEYAVVPQIVGAGKVVFLRVKMEYEFKWNAMNYFVTNEVVDKYQLPKEDAKEHYYLGLIADEETGGLTLIYALRQDKKKTGQTYGNEINIIQLDRNMNILKSSKLSFEKQQYLAFCEGIDLNEDEEGFEEYYFIFGPAREDLNKSAYDFKIVQMNDNLEITGEIPVRSHYSFWKIDDMITPEGKDEAYFFGPADNREVTYYFAAAGGEFGMGNPFVGVEFTATQMMKIKNGQVEYIEATLTDDYTKKLHVPPGQQKLPAYRGNKFEKDSYHVTDDGKFFVAGQNWSTTFNPVAGTSKDVYTDVLAFYFNPQGQLVSQYGMDTRENNSCAKEYGTGQFFMEGMGHQYLYWVILETSSMWEGDLLQYPTIGKIDMTTGEISAFRIYGSESFFVDDQFPELYSPDPGKVIYLCADKFKRNVGFLRLIFD